MKKLTFLSLSILFFSLAYPGLSQDAKFGEKALISVQTLASANFRGRKTGTSAGVKTENYLAAKFREFGLIPWQGSYFQKFGFPCYSLLPGCSLELVGEDRPPLPFVYNRDFYFYAGSGDIDVTAEVLFVGYGVHAPERGYDDFDGLDVEGKIVLAMEGLPPGGPERYGPKAGWYSTKADSARTLGALALLLFDDPNQITAFPPYKVWGVSKETYFNNFAVAKVHFTLLNRILEQSGQFAVDLKRKIDRAGKPASFDTQKTLHLRCHSSYEENAMGANVIGLILGTDPVLKNELVSIGGHMDGGGLDPDGSIFYGAEDNASGTAVVLEIAERLCRENFRPLRTVLFAAWGAEEQGGFGSKYFVDNPIFPLEKNAFNLCVDNVGWGDGEFWLFSAKNFPAEFAIVQSGISPDLMKYFIPRGLGGSDSYFFQQKGIPVLFAHTTQSQPYNHHPLDTPLLINPSALQNVTQFMYQALKTLANYRGNLIHPNRSALFAHRYMAVADSQEDLLNFKSEDNPRLIAEATSKYRILRRNGIDICVQDIPSSQFREAALGIKFFRDATRKINPSIAILEKTSQLQGLEEDQNFLVALKISGIDSFDSELPCLEILHELGARILRLDLGSAESSDYRMLFDQNHILSNFGKSLLEKTDTLGLVLELESSSKKILDQILEIKKKPAWVATAASKADELIREVANSSYREKVYFKIPIPAAAEGFSPEIRDDFKVFHELGYLTACLLNPSAYAESGQFENFTISLFQEKYPEEEIKWILGENFIRVFSANLKN